MSQKWLIEKLRNDPAMTDWRWMAYALATAKHETANTFEPICEYGQRAYFDKYEPGTRIGKSLGNTQVGDGFLYRGRGHVMITGHDNYLNFSAITGIDLIREPDRALEPEVSYLILSHGMTRGSFTGKNLATFINPTKCDYFNARKIINWLDQAAVIAGYAKDFEATFSPRRLIA